MAIIRGRKGRNCCLFQCAKICQRKKNKSFSASTYFGRVAVGFEGRQKLIAKTYDFTIRKWKWNSMNGSNRRMTKLAKRNEERYIDWKCTTWCCETKECCLFHAASPSSRSAIFSSFCAFSLSRFATRAARVNLPSMRLGDIDSSEYVWKGVNMQSTWRQRNRTKMTKKIE